MTDDKSDIQEKTNAPPCEMRDLLRLSIEAVARNSKNHGQAHAPREVHHFMDTHLVDLTGNGAGVEA